MVAFYGEGIIVGYIVPPLTIDVRACHRPPNLPNASFDLVINRHGGFHPCEALLELGNLFIAQQVGGDNDRDLIDMVLNCDALYSHAVARAAQRKKGPLSFRQRLKVGGILESFRRLYYPTCPVSSMRAFVETNGFAANRVGHINFRRNDQKLHFAFYPLG